MSYNELNEWFYNALSLYTTDYFRYTLTDF